MYIKKVTFRRILIKCQNTDGVVTEQKSLTSF